MPKSSFTPLAPLEAIQVAEAVLALDPLGNDNCPYCAHPNRRQLDIDLLTNATVGTVVESHQLAVREHSNWHEDREFISVCGNVERHRRLHVLKVFESLQDAEANIPDATSPTIKFIDWTVGEYIKTYQISDEPKDALASLSGLNKALQTRAAIRGEIANDKNKLAKTIDTEVVLTDVQKRQMLELEARRLGLKLIDPKQLTIKATPSTD